MDLQSKTVLVIQKDGTEKQTAIGDVNPGEVLMLKRNAKIYVDGMVTFGNSHLGESMLSGEPVPVLSCNQSKIHRIK